MAGVDENLDDGYVSAGFAEHEDGTGFVLLVQRGTEPPDEQDAALGLDTYCLVTADATHYGGITELGFAGNVLRITLTAEAQHALGWPYPTVEAALPAPTIPALVATLPTLIR